MVSTDAQLTDMLKEVKSKSNDTIILERCLFALVVSALLFGNFMTLLVLVLNRQMRTVPNMFVASLAVSDFSTGIFSNILSFYSGIVSKWPFGDATCRFQGFLSSTLALISVHTMALMAMNRYFRIVKPAKYRSLFTKTKTKIMIVALWIYSAFPSLLFILSGQKVVYHPFKNFCHIHQFGGGRAFSAIRLVIYLALPSCVILFSYFRIFQKVRNHNQNFHFPNGTMSAVNVEEIKITHTLFMIVACVQICWVPIFAVDIADRVHGRWIFPREVYVAYSFLATLNSALNPIILVLRNRNFRKEYFELLRCNYFRPKSVVAPLFVINNQTGRTAVDGRT